MALSKMFYKEKILETFHIGGFTFEALTKFRNGFSNLFCRRGGRDHLYDPATEEKSQGRVPVRVAIPKPFLSVIHVGSVRATDSNTVRARQLGAHTKAADLVGILRRNKPLK